MLTGVGMHKCLSHKAFDICSKGNRVVRPPDNPDAVVETNGVEKPSPRLQRKRSPQQPAAQFVLQEAFNGIHGYLTSCVRFLSAANGAVRSSGNRVTRGHPMITISRGNQTTKPELQKGSDLAGSRRRDSGAPRCGSLRRRRLRGPHGRFRTGSDVRESVGPYPRRLPQAPLRSHLRQSAL